MISRTLVHVSCQKNFCSKLCYLPRKMLKNELTYSTVLTAVSESACTGTGPSVEREKEANRYLNLVKTDIAYYITRLSFFLPSKSN